MLKEKREDDEAGSILTVRLRYFSLKVCLKFGHRVFVGRCQNCSQAGTFLIKMPILISSFAADRPFKRERERVKVR